ncbi:MAG: hypothetical protein AB7V16_07445 [Vulcanibacillus sp.]
MSLQKIEDDKTKYFYDVENNLEDGNILLCQQFGYNPNLVLLDSNTIPVDKMLEYVRLQSRSIKYRVQNKTTYNGYYINFNMLGLPGEVYVAFYDNEKLVRSLDWASTFSFAATADFSKPFKHLIANKSLSFSILNKLDEGHVLDEMPPLFLDSAVSSKPTNHIFCEFVLDRVLEDPFLIDDRYSRYLEDGSQYSRSAKHYVHNGVQLNVPLFKSSAYDFLTEGSEYTIANLKLKAATTYQFSRRYTVSGLASLDDGRTLDEDITYKMDGSNEITDPITVGDFAYISVGGGSSSLPNHTFSDVLNDSNKIIFYYTLNDEENSTAFKDYSNNKYDLISDRLQTFTNSSFGNTINFKGVPLYSNVNMSETSYTLSFWYDPEMNSDSQCIFDFGFLKFIYNNALSRLEIYFELTQYNITVNADEHYVNIEINSNDSTLYIFIDTVLVLSIPITQVYAGVNSLYLGTDSTKDVETAFYGTINEFNMILGFLTQDQKEYVFDNKIPLITKLNKFYNRMLLSNFEKAESLNSIFLAATAYNEAFLLNDEFLFNYTSSVEWFNGLFKYNNIVPKSVGIKIRHFRGSEYITSTFMDNGDGLFESVGNMIDEDYLISGSIDYVTGAYLINPYTIKTIMNEQIYPFFSTSSVTATLRQNCEPVSIKLFYTMDGVVHMANDDGLGNILGFQIDSGTSFIDYETGDLFIQFVVPTDENTDVRVQYKYRIYPIIDEDESISVFYNTKSQLDITEVAIEDINKNVLAYATFPPIRFNNRYNYLNTAFIFRM